MDFSRIDWEQALAWIGWADTAAKAYSALGWLLFAATLLWGLRMPLAAALRFTGQVVSWPVVAPARRIAKALTPPPPAPPPPLGDLALAIIDILASGPCEVVEVADRPRGVKVAGRCGVRARRDGWLELALLGPDELDVKDRLRGHEKAAIGAAALEALERIEADRVAVALQQAWVAGRGRYVGPVCPCGPNCDCEVCECDSQGHVELALDGPEACGCDPEKGAYSDCPPERRKAKGPLWSGCQCSECAK